jgi:hypothetical protein
MRRFWSPPIAALSLVLTLVGAAHPAAAQGAAALCAKAGVDDRLRPLPAELVARARKLFEIGPETSAGLVRAGTQYRCMDGKVWLCNAGANLHCGKADLGKKSEGADEYCRDNPGSESVPMYATGHATIYEWTCEGARARAGARIMEIDARGFIAENWKRFD